MFRRFSVNFALLSMLLDALAVGCALYGAAYLRPYLSFLPFAANYPQFLPLPWITYPLFAVEWVAILILFAVYDGRRNLHWLDEVGSLMLGSLLAAMAMAGTLFLSFRLVSRLLFATFVLAGLFVMIAWRALYRLVRRLKPGVSQPRRGVIILGAGEVGRQLEQQILANPQLNLSVLGFLDNQTPKNRTSLLGALDDLQEVVKQFAPQDVVIALPQHAYQRTNDLIAELHHLPVKVWLIPDYFRLALHKAAVEEFAGIPMLDLCAPAISDSQRLLKRVFDLGVALVTLPIALCVMAVIALAIRLEASGPILFIQERVGENGRLFKMYKFRTMQPEKEEPRLAIECQDNQGRYIQKRASDPRVTRLGKILRRTSLDELPQLFNVLKGDMSLVGPRPELPQLVECYETWQRQRFSIPQGITGWWQINGRSDRPMHLHTEDDLYYIQHYSILLDIWILMKTIMVVLQGKGAF